MFKTQPNNTLAHGHEINSRPIVNDIVSVYFFYEPNILLYPNFYIHRLRLYDLCTVYRSILVHVVAQY